MNVRKELEATGCISYGHFVGTSGKHLAGYCNNDRIMPHTAKVNEIARLLVEPFKDEGIETVAAPATGAIPLAHLSALHLEAMTGRKIYAVWADKTKVNGEKAFVFERSGYAEAVKGKKVLIVEDIVNQMFTMKKVIEAVRAAGGDIRGVASIEHNAGVSAEALGIPKYHGLCLIQYKAWMPEDCARVGLCAEKEPIVLDVAHGEDFKAAYPDYPGGFVRLQG